MGCQQKHHRLGNVTSLEAGYLEPEINIPITGLSLLGSPYYCVLQCMSVLQPYTGSEFQLVLAPNPVILSIKDFNIWILWIF